MLIRCSLAGLLSVVLTVLSPGGVSGQDYPNKPIRILSGSVGSNSDVPERIIAQGLTSALGQPVIVENRGGVTTSAEIAAKATSDGYTLLAAGATLWTEPLLRKAPYDPVLDFSPITMATSSPLILVVHPSVPVNSVRELIALAKARPGELNYASGGIGGANHLAGELFKAMAGVNIVRIGYSGTGPAVNALLGGEVQLSFPSAVVVTPQVKSGKLRALAVTSAMPSALAPGLPTVSGSGLPGYESAGTGTSIFAPAKTPVAIIKRMNQEIVRILRTAEAKARLLDAGVEVVGSSPEQLAATTKSEMARLGKVIKDAGIKVE